MKPSQQHPSISRCGRITQTFHVLQVQTTNARLILIRDRCELCKQNEGTVRPVQSQGTVRIHGTNHRYDSYTGTYTWYESQVRFIYWYVYMVRITGTIHILVRIHGTNHRYDSYTGTFTWYESQVRFIYWYVYTWYEAHE